MRPRWDVAVMKREDGAALVELALVIVVLLTLVVGTITYGMALGLHQSITHAASSAARAAITLPAHDAGAIDARARGVVDDQLAWLGARSDHVQTHTRVEPCSGAGQCVHIEVTYPYGTMPIVPSFLGLPIPEHIGSTAVAQLEPEP